MSYPPSPLDPKPGELEQFEYNWTIADFYAGMNEPGCTLIALGG